jgi:hypothetical protein
VFDVEHEHGFRYLNDAELYIVQKVADKEAPSPKPDTTLYPHLEAPLLGLHTDKNMTISTSFADSFLTILAVFASTADRRVHARDQEWFSAVRSSGGKPGTLTNDKSTIKRSALAHATKPKEAVYLDNCDVVVLAVNHDKAHSTVFIVDFQAPSVILTSITYTALPQPQLPTAVTDEAQALAWALESEYERNRAGRGDITISITARGPFHWAGHRNDTAVPALGAAVMPILSGTFVDTCIRDDAESKKETVYDMLVFTLVTGIVARDKIMGEE